VESTTVDGKLKLRPRFGLRHRVRKKNERRRGIRRIRRTRNYV
jgi:hypothetical protein